MITLGNHLTQSLALRDVYNSHSAFKFRNIFVLDSDNNGRFSVGLDLNDINGCSNKERWIGFIEFNPNKHIGSILDWVFEEIHMFAFAVTVRRFDIAIDFEIETANVSLKKDRRKYWLIYNSPSDKTEYLGLKHDNGYTKLYNKKIESNLDCDALTRLEITCVGEFPYEEFLKKVPELIFVKNEKDMDMSGLVDTDKVLLMMMSELDFDRKMFYFKKLGRKKQEKLRSYVFNDVDIDYVPDEKTYNEILDFVKSFTKPKYI